MASFQMFDLGRAYSDAERIKTARNRNALFQQQQDDRAVVTQAAQGAMIDGQYDPETHMRLLEESGRPELVQGLRQSMLQHRQKSLDYILRSAPVVGPDNYAQWRDTLVRQGMATEADLPPKYKGSLVERIHRAAKAEQEADRGRYADPAPIAGTDSIGQRDTRTGKITRLGQRSGGTTSSKFSDPYQLYENGPYVQRDSTTGQIKKVADAPRKTDKGGTAMIDNFNFIKGRLPDMPDNEIVALLTDSKSKSPEDTYIQLIRSLMSGGFVEPPEAKQTAADIVQTVYGVTPDQFRKRRTKPANSDNAQTSSGSAMDGKSVADWANTMFRGTDDQ